MHLIWISDSSGIPETIKLLKENIYANIHNLGVDEHFLGHKTWDIKENINQVYFTKIKNVPLDRHC